MNHDLKSSKGGIKVYILFLDMIYSFPVVSFLDLEAISNNNFTYLLIVKKYIIFKCVINTSAMIQLYLEVKCKKGPWGPNFALK